MKETGILVTGANGFLGQAILSGLPANYTSVRATDLSPSSRVSRGAYKSADITRPEELASVLDKMTIVIHAAGLAHLFSRGMNSNERFRQSNEIGTANVASAAAAGVKHFILISSVAVYGPSSVGFCDENTPCEPIGPYALSKHKAELRAIEIARESGMALTILRLATLYGEGDPGNVGRLMRTIDRKRFVWIGNGSNKKSLLHREDAARACVAVLQNTASGVNIFNVSAPPCTMCEVVEGLAEALGRRIPSIGIPASAARGISGLLTRMPSNWLKSLATTAKKWLADDVYNASKFDRVFNFHTRVNLVDGLRREVAWYREELAKRGS